MHCGAKSYELKTLEKLDQHVKSGHAAVIFSLFFLGSNGCVIVE